MASVKRRVAAPQTPVAVSDTNVPKEVRVRLPELQTLAGIDVMLERSCDTIEEDAVFTTAAREVEALLTRVSVFAFTALVMPEV